MNDAPLESSRDCGDTELLGRFSVRHDDDAFAELVRRHGQLVWGVCRRRLDRHEDAEDAFQTTFLQLAMKSRAIHRPEALAAWLHRTATRTSLRLASRSTRELADDLPASGRDAFAEIARKESIAAIDEELLRLPRRSRDAIVLFHLEGLDRKQVATRLGVSEAAVKALLARGRSLLRARLARRGVALPMLLPLAVDPVPAAAADAACRSSVSLVRSGVSPLNFVSLSTKGLPPMLAWITNKSSVAVLVGAACLSLLLVGRGTAENDGTTSGAGTPSIETALAVTGPNQPKGVSVAMASGPENKSKPKREMTTSQWASVLLGIPVEQSATNAAEREKRLRQVRSANMIRSASDAERKIQYRLHDNAELVFPNTPLRTCLEYLPDVYSINIILDEAALAKDNISPDDPIDVNLTGISLESGLDIILEPLGLTHVIRNDVMLVTTKLRADSEREIRFYDLAGMADAKSTAEQITELMEPLTTTGRGAMIMGPVIVPRENLLMVTASWTDHKQIHEILSLMQAAGEENAAAK